VLKWSIVIAALSYALLFEYFEWGVTAAYVLAALPVALAYMVSGTWLAAAFMLLLPMYFVIGQITAGWPHFTPYLPIDRAMPLSPGWIAVYGSLYMCAFVLPLLVVRGRELFHQTLKAYLFVMLVSYAGFLLYPTTAPRPDHIPVDSFAAWALQLFYDIDQPYGCFPSLHVAYSLVAALACYRLDRRVGIAASLWAVLIAVSTIYTKQHFAADAIAGAVEGVAAYVLFLRGRPHQPVPERDRALAPRRAAGAVAAYLVLIAMCWAAYQMGLGPVRD
jgi:membrane-associated phospholipid phosphatase